MADITGEESGGARRAKRSRTARAGVAFLQAIAADLETLSERLRSRLRGSVHTLRGRRIAIPRMPRTGWRIVALVAAALLLVTLVIVAMMAWALQDVPLANPLPTDPGQAVILEAADGAPLGRIGALKVGHVPLQEFPATLVQAVITTEDRRYYSHFGIDVIGIMRAAWRNIAAGGIVEGGSTITQQLMKFRLLGHEQTFARKIREALMAIWLERVMSKDEILERYLNSVYLGAGTYGMPAAARLYYGKTPAELTLAESALLAGLMKAPSRYNPVRDLAAAHERAAVVLDAMVENGVLSPEEARAAKERPAELNRPTSAALAGTWLADWIRDEALALGGSFQGNVRARTTLQPELQRIAEEVVRDGLTGNAERDVTQAALVAMRPDGAVVAMVGGRDYEESQFNRATQAMRQPGSAFKLFVYLAALRKGYRLEQAIDATTPEIDGWTPENFDNRERGRMTLAEAFAASVNTAAVNLAMEVGLDEVIAAARDLGIDAPLQPLPSLALGAQEASLLDVTAAYAAILAGRAPVEPWGIAAAAPASQDRLLEISPPREAQRPLGAPRNDLVRLLRLTVTRGTARAAALPGFAAGKTGTSQGHRDAWFIGFTDQLVVGVWVGNDDGSPMKKVTGGSLPASLWKSFMQRAGRSDEVVAVAPTSRRQDDGPRDGAARDPQQETGADERSPVQCDIRACSARYRSFRASDCTYQPYGGGPRKLCDAGFRRGADRSGRRRERAPGGLTVLDQLRGLQ